MVDKTLPSSSSMELMRLGSFSFFLGAAACAALLTSCETSRLAGGKAYHVTAYRPHDSSAVRVKVSLSKQNIYVMEGDRCLMAVACSVGIPEKPTPKGNFTIYSKQERKRSGSYGFSVQGNRVVPSTGGGAGRYVGYPMGYWCEFAPAYDARLYPFARGGCAEVLCPGQDRHAGEHRDIATRGWRSRLQSTASG